MNPTLSIFPMLAQFPGGGPSTSAIAIIGIVVVIFLLLIVWASRYTKVGPN